jgi:hypothetical protein
MKRFWPILLVCALWTNAAMADGRPGTVTYSDGHKLTGAIELSPGKQLLLYTSDGQVSLQLAQVKEMQFKPETETMEEGFYFPNAGQTTKVKTGDVYPTRQVKTNITLSDGKVLTGHLYTTMVYVEDDDGTADKVPLMAKQTGTDGQKLADLIYPTDILFDAGGNTAGSAQIDLTHAGFTTVKNFIALSLPDVVALPASQTAGKFSWSVPMGDPKRIIFSVETTDGIHLAWPAQEADADVKAAVDKALKIMQDFYDTRIVLGCFSGDDGTDVYTAVLMKRMGATLGYAADKISYSIVILRWKYDLTDKTTTLLGRVPLFIGRAEGGAPPIAVIKQPELLRDISTNSAIVSPGPQGAQP